MYEPYLAAELDMDEQGDTVTLVELVAFLEHEAAASREGLTVPELFAEALLQLDDPTMPVRAGRPAWVTQCHPSSQSGTPPQPTEAAIVEAEDARFETEKAELSAMVTAEGAAQRKTIARIHNAACCFVPTTLLRNPRQQS